MLDKSSPVTGTVKQSYRPPEPEKEVVVKEVKSSFNTNNLVKLVAAAVIFAISLVGLHYDVEYAGWGIFLAVILVWNVA